MVMVLVRLVVFVAMLMMRVMIVIIVMCAMIMFVVMVMLCHSHFGNAIFGADYLHLRIRCGKLW